MKNYDGLSLENRDDRSYEVSRNLYLSEMDTVYLGRFTLTFNRKEHSGRCCPVDIFLQGLSNVGFQRLK